MTDYIAIFNDTEQQNLTRWASDTQESIKSSVCMELSDSAELYDSYTETDITFAKMGTISAAYRFGRVGRTAVLNFADALLPGGFVREGANAQEENLCKCTNLFSVISDEALHHYYTLNALRSLADGRKDYSDARKYGVYLDALIYSPNIVAYKDDSTFDEVEPMKLDVITCPAPSATLSESDAEVIFTRRIKKILVSAQMHNVDTLILGAWGCGAFGQNPTIVGKCFAKVLKNATPFGNVVFAILGDYNYYPFERAFYEEYTK